jgi:hypothetical protein
LLERKGCTDGGFTHGGFTRGGWKSSTSQGIDTVGDDEEASSVRERRTTMWQLDRGNDSASNMKRRGNVNCVWKAIKNSSNQELKKQKFEQEQDMSKKIDWDRAEKSICVRTIKRLEWIRVFVPKMDTIPTPNPCLIDKELVLHRCIVRREEKRNTMQMNNTTS